ncbi:MAG: hydroxypyruvate isomerase, partial [Gemmatimonadales bacterium]
MTRGISRRHAVGALAGIAAGTVLAPDVHAMAARSAPRRASHLRQSVSRWCYGTLSLEELCAASKKIGLSAIDLLDEKDW